MAILGRIRVGQLTVIEGDDETVFGSGAPQATVHVHDPRVWSQLLRGGRGMGESYMDGLWDTPDLTAVIRVAARNVGAIDDIRRRLSPVREPFQRARAAFKRNTPRRSRKDIAAHYDLGNELFELMLDPTLMYSCGVFEHRDATLEEASLAKLELVCEKLELGPRDHVVEIGTGWGGFAVYAATTRGCRVTTTTISREQHDYAEQRVRDAGVEHLVELRLDDYRDLRGSYDKLVSLEMIEAVGWQDFGTFFERCSDLLAPNGTMLLQAITMDDRAYRGREGVQELHPHLRLPGRLPAVAGGHRQVRGAAHRHAHGAPRGPDAALRRDAAALARELRGGDGAARGARLRRALPPAVADVPELLRGGLRRAPDRPRADRARQAAGRDRRAGLGAAGGD